MPVMAAGMHLPRKFRGVRLAGLFQDRKRIHVGPKADHAAAAILPPADDPDDASSAYACRDLVEPEGLQLPGHLRRRPVDLVEDFRMPVQFLPPRGNIIGKPVIIYWSYDASTEALSKPMMSIEHLLDVVQHFPSKTRWRRTLRLVRGYPLS